MIEFSFQTKSDVVALLSDSGAKPKRGWGQNFLIDGNLLRRLIASADIEPHDTVLEVGAGTGAVTECLASLAASVVAVEIDPVLHGILAHRLTARTNVTLLCEDVLTGKHQVASAVLHACREAAKITSGRMMLVANLPYNVATPLLMELLLGDERFDRFCFTVQREVADRFVARERTKAYGPISVITQTSCDVRRLALLPPSVFWPQPKVESAMLRLDVRRNSFQSRAGLRRFAELVHAAFAHRRKTLKYNLARVIGVDACAALAGDFDLGLRPEALDIQSWVRLGRRVADIRG